MLAFYNFESNKLDHAFQYLEAEPNSIIPLPSQLSPTL